MSDLEKRMRERLRQQRLGNGAPLATEGPETAFGDDRVLSDSAKERFKKAGELAGAAALWTAARAKEVSASAIEKAKEAKAHHDAARASRATNAPQSMNPDGQPAEAVPLVSESTEDREVAPVEEPPADDCDGSEHRDAVPTAVPADHVRTNPRPEGERAEEPPLGPVAGDPTPDEVTPQPVCETPAEGETEPCAAPTVAPPGNATHPLGPSVSGRWVLVGAAVVTVLGVVLAIWLTSGTAPEAVVPTAAVPSRASSSAAPAPAPAPVAIEVPASVPAAPEEQPARVELDPIATRVVPKAPPIAAPTRSPEAEAGVSRTAPSRAPVRARATPSNETRERDWHDDADRAMDQWAEQLP